MEINSRLEAAYPKCQGLIQNQDEQLRSQLVGYANDAMLEIEALQPWNLSYTRDSTITTTQGTGTYLLPVQFRQIDRVYWIDVAGRERELLPRSPNQAREIFGEGSIAPQGEPRRYAIEGTSIQFWPIPDFNGSSSGNYNIFIEGYQRFTPMVETSGNTTASSPTLTVNSGIPGYLQDQGVPAAGALGLSVRGAGNLKLVRPSGASPNVQDNLVVASWTGLGATTLTMSSNAIVNTTNAQVFFNSTPWLVSRFPKVIAFAVAREIATYLKDDYQGWETRYQHELELMQGWDERWTRNEILMFAASAQQLRPIGADLYGSPSQFSGWWGSP